jgi:hypothetical protein
LEDTQGMPDGGLQLGTMHSKKGKAARLHEFMHSEVARSSPERGRLAYAAAIQPCQPPPNTAPVRLW